MADLANGVNAWIYLNEDEPPGTNYNSTNSCFQTLINNKTYNSANFLGIAFFAVTPAVNGDTIEIGCSTHEGGCAQIILFGHK